MQKLQDHLRKTFLAGIFAAVPIAVTIFIIWYIDDQTRVISRHLFGRSIPFIGIVIAILAIYLGGLVATTLLGKWLIRTVDYLLSRLPGLKHLYAAWKQIALTPGGGEGTFAKVVLIADESAHMHMLGFTSGQSIDANSDTLCVFVPNAPNPIQGKLYFVPSAHCRAIDMTAEEAFKLILSTGNYIPTNLAAACPRQKRGTS